MTRPASADHYANAGGRWSRVVQSALHIDLLEVVAGTTSALDIPERRASLTSMRPRKFLPVEAVQLVGGRLCLDFVNTTGARSSASPRERLNTYADALTWSRRVGLIDATTHRLLNKRAKAHVAEAATALRALRGKRELFYRLFGAAVERKPPPDRSVSAMNRLWHELERRRALVSDGKKYLFQLRFATSEFDALIWPIISSVVDLLTSPDITRVKRCGECDWLFLDESKNGSRTWCKKECGDRVRARRHYQHVRQGRNRRSKRLS
jgi:predicted RNA-binding Zn ribbon-like protein